MYSVTLPKCEPCPSPISLERELDEVIVDPAQTVCDIWRSWTDMEQTFKKRKRRIPQRRRLKIKFAVNEACVLAEPPLGGGPVLDPAGQASADRVALAHHTELTLRMPRIDALLGIQLFSPATDTKCTDELYDSTLETERNFALTVNAMPRNDALLGIQLSLLQLIQNARMNFMLYFRNGTQLCSYRKCNAAQ
jgi:hypothetical protein